MSNANLHRAKREKNDEFYTREEDIAREMQYYTGPYSHKAGVYGNPKAPNLFNGKRVLCNCNDYNHRAFADYFEAKYHSLELVGLCALEYKPGGRGAGHVFDGKTWTPFSLPNDGDFRKVGYGELVFPGGTTFKPDIVVTNPPFSLFDDYITQLADSSRRFLVLGPKMALTKKRVWPVVQEGRMWLGVTMTDKFETVGGEAAAPTYWYTNMEHRRRGRELLLWTEYYSDVDLFRPEAFPTYDNYEAVEVSQVKHIPRDYEGEMGVPISFMTRYNPDQFEIVGGDRQLTGGKRFFVSKRELPARIVIRRRATARST